MNNRYEIAREFADAIRSEDIVKIILFGSVARGDDTEESDIDILIITTNSDELSDEINRVAVDIILEKDNDYRAWLHANYGGKNILELQIREQLPFHKYINVNN